MQGARHKNNMNGRDFDIVVWGATGFTGALVVEYLLAQKKAGRIRHLGFSSHARAETIDQFLNWNDAFEFVQIQLNYLDWSVQDAKRKYEVITDHGIPVIVMEGVRGGRLASLDEQAAAILKGARPDDSIASWAFRLLQSLPNVQVVLSGMSTMEEIKAAEAKAAK